MVLRMGAGALAMAVIVLLSMVLLFVPVHDANAAEVCDPVTIQDFELPKAKTDEDEITETTIDDPETSTTRTETTKSKRSKKTTTTAEKKPQACTPFVYSMTYPLANPGRVISVLGDLRDGGERLHWGTDVAVSLMTPVLAVHDGVVASVHNSRASEEDCCWLTIKHDDGWSSLYIHLNNDTFGTDDGLGRGVRVDLEVGDPVRAGELIGWVGDSGNAEDTEHPHMHFELRMPDGNPIDAVASLGAASRSQASDLAVIQEHHPYSVASQFLASLGVPWSCDETGLLSCPDEPADVVELAKAVTMIIDADTEPLHGIYGVEALYGDPTPSNFILEKMLGCDDEGCEPERVTRAELARLAALTARQLISPQGLFGYEPGERLDLPTKKTAVAFLQMIGNLGNCQLPLDDRTPLTRGEASYLLVSWAGIADIDACPEVPLPVR